ncbi:MAG: mechanosensitive ion channel family protein [Candidatus Nomurabacteria bacterium]|jgi:small conductance mechanosensitive channel|nr:mechanosensitive ion channel family protein [Candidatus Nomurabacteria bacterium]
MNDFFIWFYEKFVVATIDWLKDNTMGILILLVVAAAAYIFGAKLIKCIVYSIVMHKRGGTTKDKQKRAKTVELLANSIWKALVIVLACVCLVKVFSPSTNISSLIVGLGAVGVAISFGAQSLIKDFLSGLFIITENQYRVGDIIEVAGAGISGAVGRVERVGIRSTTLRDLDGNVHFIPNGSIVHVENKTMGYSLSHFDIQVNPDNDIEKVIEVINKVGEELAVSESWAKKIIEAPHFYRIGDISATAVTMSIVGKTLPADQWQLSSDVKMELFKAFKKAKIKLA